MALERLRERLARRKTLILKEPLVKMFFSSVVFPTTGLELDAELDRITQEKVREWEARGVPPGLRAMALDLARSWADRMANFAAPGMPDIQRKILPGLYKRGLEDVADPWIKAMTA